MKLLQPGTEAPQFSLPNQHGSQVSLAEFQGSQPVVLIFYPKDATSGCTLELHEFNRRRAEFEEFDAALFGISGDGVDSHQSFCEAEGYELSLLADTENSVRRDYGAQELAGIPGRVTYVIDREGKIAGYCNSAIDMKLHAARALEILRDLPAAD
ncbi:MAG: peroxiredoxin [bacterium]